MIRNNYMSTGEFAKMMCVTKHTLFHYDQIGLFCPEIVTEQGYRYYSVYQMESFNTILLLKDLGMSLDEIRDFLNNRSPETLLDIFTKKEQQINSELARLTATKKWMEQRKKKLLIAKEQDWSDIKIRHIPNRYYLYKEVEDTSTESFCKKINELILEFESYGTREDYDIAYFQHAAQIEHGIYDGYDNIALLLEEKPPNGTFKLLPEGDYLTVYHIGHWETIGEAYKKLLAYKASHHICTEQNYLEFYIVDNFIAKELNEYVTEISVRILKEESRSPFSF